MLPTYSERNNECDKDREPDDALKPHEHLVPTKRDLRKKSGYTLGLSHPEKLTARDMTVIITIPTLPMHSVSDDSMTDKLKIAR